MILRESKCKYIVVTLCGLGTKEIYPLVRLSMAPKARSIKKPKPNKSVKKTIKKSPPKLVKSGQKCRDCKQSFGNNFSYARHSLMVHQKQVQCPIGECTKKLKSISGLQNHFRTTHKNACNLCGHSNKNKSGLQVHLALVHNLKRCTCGGTRRERMNAYFD